MPPRRKKWTEEEERTLIETYKDLLTNGTLNKMKTREKKFRPIAAQVNSLHHNLDPVAFPWQWSWKDTSTKVQNMRHQYLLVKQKIKKPTIGGEPNDQEGVLENGVDPEEGFDWVEGISHWPNFLRYKGVFGDLPLGGFGNCSDGNELVGSGNHDSGNGFGMDLGEYGGFGVLGWEDGNQRVQDEGDDGIEYEEVFAKRRKKMKGSEKRAWMFFGNKFAELKEREAVYEEREVERERKRQRREQVWGKLEQERERKFDEREQEREEKERARETMRRERNGEWEAMEKESAERERRRREEELNRQKEWENRMEQRRAEWKNRISSMLSQHRAAMDEMQTRILHDQQNLTNQMIGLLSQWAGHSGTISDHSGVGNPYLTQRIQNLHHMSGIVHSEENRVEEDNHDDQFIVDDG